MIACIQRHGSSTYCGRCDVAGEFVFIDAEHAADFYDARNVQRPLHQALWACQTCVDMVKHHRGPTHGQA